MKQKGTSIQLLVPKVAFKVPFRGFRGYGIFREVHLYFEEHQISEGQNQTSEVLGSRNKIVWI